MAEQERDLIHALAGKQSARGNRVPERVHRRHRAVWHLYRVTIGIDLVQDRERGAAMFVGGSLLSLPERPLDVPLSKGSGRASREDECIRRSVAGSKLVPSEEKCELPRDRHGSGRAVGLRGTPVALAINLPAERQLSVVDVFEADVRLRQATEFGHARAG
jgi:hypothetical protein